MPVYHRSTATVLAAQPLPEFLERVAGGGLGHLGTDLHRDRYHAVPQDLHRHPRMHVEGGERGSARLAVPWTVILGTWALAIQRSKLRLDPLHTLDVYALESPAYRERCPELPGGQRACRAGTMSAYGLGRIQVVKAVVSCGGPSRERRPLRSACP